LVAARLTTLTVTASRPPAEVRGSDFMVTVGTFDFGTTLAFVWNPVVESQW
jgi:hypothetical protein